MRVLLAAFAVMALVTVNATAGTGTVQGSVADLETRQPLRGATVMLEAVGTSPLAGSRTYGAFAGKDGSFTVDNVPSGQWRAKVTYVGYKPITRVITVDDDKTTNASFDLPFDVKQIEEVVVTGLASRHPKSESEVAVSRVDAEELQKANVYTDFTQLLQGKAAGVNVQQSSGNVGGGMRFTVRGGGGLNGNGLPLIFVDGARIVAGEVAPTDIGGQNFSAMANINPQDIENIEILKGPAGAALYGTAGSNGVVLITTKRGLKSQDNLSIQAKAIFGWNENPKVYDSTIIESAEDVNALFRNGPIEEYNVSLNGNSGGLGYFLSYGYRDEQGIIEQNGLTRHSVRTNFEFSPINDLTVTMTGSYANSDVQRPQGDNNILSDYAVKYLINGSNFGSYYLFGADSTAMAAVENNLATERLTASGQLLYRPGWAPGLTVNGVVGIDINGFRNEAYNPPGLFYPGFGFDGQRSIVNQNINRLNIDLNASYSMMFGNNVASTTRLGMQSFDTKITDGVSTQQEFASTKIRALQSSGTFIGTSDGVVQNREAGIYLQEEVVISETYFVSAGLRLDNTTLLNAESQSRLLPRVSGMVRLDKFDFLPETFNLFKVRAAWGQSGQPPAITGADPLRWATARSGYGVGYVVGSIGNPDVELEAVSELELGLEFEIDNRYGLDFTYYMGSGRNSIVNFANTPSTGLTATGVPRNVGGIENWGFEANAYASIIRTVDWGLDLNLIVNNQNNEVTDLGGAQPLGSSVGDQFIRVGSPRSSWFNFKALGANFAPDGSYAGTMYSDSIEFLANAVPEWTGSFGLNFRFLEHFSLYGLLEWSSGFSVLNQSRNFQVQFSNSTEFNDLQDQLFGENALTPGTPEYIEAANKFAKMDPTYSTNFIESGNWLRLREVSLRVDATTWIRDAFGGRGLTGLNLVFSVRNAFIITDYSGADPEVNARGGQGSGVDRSIEFNTLPQPRVFNFQLNFSF